jgi:Holliday junction resolvasome RuvABC endonuclease subunit
MSWPRNAGAAVRVALAWGVLTALCAARGVPLLQVSPQELKRRVTGSAGASKERGELALERRFGGPLPLTGPAGQHEHQADALGAAVACLDHDVVRLARAYVGSTRASA